MDYIQVMTRLKTENRTAANYTVRRSKSGRFVVLADGRKIVEPPSGGNFSKREIRAAVAKAREKRLEAEAG